MAPYAIAHLKVGLKLHETGYRFRGDERVRIFLTNALEPANQSAGQMSFASWAPALAHEAAAVDAVKRDTHFTVVLGNPPYSGNSANRGDWIESLINTYRMVNGQPLGEMKVWLRDDYVKFIRLTQWLVSRAGAGVVGLITNNSFFDGLTFRGMRASLLEDATTAAFLNLHGNGNLKERSPDGSRDENVFDILQGLGVVRRAPGRGPRKVEAADLFGTRGVKYSALASEGLPIACWHEVDPRHPNYFVTDRPGQDHPEYEGFTSIADLFRTGGLGFQSHRDNFVVAFTRAELLDRLRVFYDPARSDAEIRDRFGIRMTSGSLCSQVIAARRSSTKVP